jgi:hypothetical protein
VNRKSLAKQGEVRAAAGRSVQSYDVPMPRNWIEQGLQKTREREEAFRLASERRLEEAALIRDKAPDLMRRLVAEVRDILAEYGQKAPREGSALEFEELPQEGFCLRKSTFPRVTLECRPGYETHVVYCNRTRMDDHESEASELAFGLDMVVDDSNRIVLRHDSATFTTVADAVEFLLKPVLFPAL